MFMTNFVKTIGRILLHIIDRIITDLKLFVIMDKKKTCFRYFGSFRFEILDIYLQELQ